MARNDVCMLVLVSLSGREISTALNLKPWKTKGVAGAQVRCNKKRLRSLLFPCRDRSFPGWLTKQKVNARI